MARQTNGPLQITRVVRCDDATRLSPFREPTHPAFITPGGKIRVLPSLRSRLALAESELKFPRCFPASVFAN
jgi:hypothetical protein